MARADEAPPQMLATMGRWPAEPMAERTPPADLGGAGIAPRSRLAPQGVAADDRVRALRFQRQVDRGVRDLHFDAAQWLGSRKGATMADREQAAQKLLLPLPPQAPPPPASDAATFVRATLLDPAFELK
jgi:hypothetical protein